MSFSSDPSEQIYRAGTMSSTGQTVVPAVFAFQVSLRRGPQLFAKHRYERTGAVISSLESGAGHFFPGGQQLQSMQQTKLLPPLAEMHSCFLKEYALVVSVGGTAFALQKYRISR